MQRAIAKVASGLTRFDRRSGSGDLASLHFVCVDEFQDFSDLFYRLLCAIREKNPRIQLFCVGDDWQAINGFAGSDLRFFKQFDYYIGQAHHLSISTNYRSSKAIVEVGNALMQGLGSPAVPKKETEGQVLLADMSKFIPSKFELQRHPGDSITPMVSRIANASLAKSDDVVMLCRCNMLPWYIHFGAKGSGGGRGLESYLDLIRSLFAKDLRRKISISTAHKYKGLEKATVIVMDAVARSYPLIHPDWIFARILGDDPITLAKADRRLLYVALTRAVEKLVIVTDGQGSSPFLDELSQFFPLRPINWDQHPPLRNDSNLVVVAVKNQDNFKGTPPTIVIKDQLKAAGYRYQCKNHASWEKIFPSRHFCLEQLMSEVWVEAADGVEVRVFDQLENVVGIFRVNGGQWTTCMDKLASLDSIQEVKGVPGISLSDDTHPANPVDNVLSRLFDF